MKKGITISFIVLIIWACAGEKPVDLKLGEKVFKTNCVLCHGPDGDLEVNGAKDLALSVMNVEERVAIITNGKNQMMAFKSLLDEEKIRAVAHYTLKFSNDE